MPLDKMTIGVPKEYFPENLDPGIRSLCERSVDVLKSLGAKVVDVELPHTSLAIPVYYIVAPAEASSNLARFDGVRYGMRAEAASLRDMYAETRSIGFGESCLAHTFYPLDTTTRTTRRRRRFAD
jgi:aspartyl-tRNA(Asn)/glutamyl-tRNA(Gln) amidotransferase subunit A